MEVRVSKREATAVGKEWDKDFVGFWGSHVRFGYAPNPVVLWIGGLGLDLKFRFLLRDPSYQLEGS